MLWKCIFFLKLIIRPLLCYGEIAWLTYFQIFLTLTYVLMDNYCPCLKHLANNFNGTFIEINVLFNCFSSYIDKGVARIFSSGADSILMGAEIFESGEESPWGIPDKIRGRISYYKQRETSFGVCPLCPTWENFQQGQISLMPTARHASVHKSLYIYIFLSYSSL